MRLSWCCPCCRRRLCCLCCCCRRLGSRRPATSAGQAGQLGKGGGKLLPLPSVSFVGLALLLPSVSLALPCCCLAFRSLVLQRQPTGRAGGGGAGSWRSACLLPLPCSHSACRPVASSSGSGGGRWSRELEAGRRRLGRSSGPLCWLRPCRQQPLRSPGGAGEVEREPEGGRTWRRHAPQPLPPLSRRSPPPPRACHNRPPRRAPGRGPSRPNGGMCLGTPLAALTPASLHLSLTRSQAAEKSPKAGPNGGKGRPLLAALRGAVSPVLLEAFTLTFLAEWGDRSQIATIGALRGFRACRRRPPHRRRRHRPVRRRHPPSRALPHAARFAPTSCRRLHAAPPSLPAQPWPQPPMCRALVLQRPSVSSPPPVFCRPTERRPGRGGGRVWRDAGRHPGPLHVHR